MLFHPRNDKSRNGAKGRGTYKFRSPIINPGEKNTPIPLHYERTRRSILAEGDIYIYITLNDPCWISPSFLLLPLSNRSIRQRDYQRDLAWRIVSKEKGKKERGEYWKCVAACMEQRGTRNRVFFRGRMCETTRRNARAVVKFIHRLQKNYLRSAAIPEKVPPR